ncbi:MAG: hypothetical protein ACI9MC_002823 [Kiritimatiellia bacterium]|jgi:hypothetical protein
MKVVAHPMLVAVALGLLGPGVLASESDDLVDDVAVRKSSDSLEDQVTESMSSDEGPYWSRLDIGEADYPGETDQQSAELAWLDARSLV